MTESPPIVPSLNCKKGPDVYMENERFVLCTLKILYTSLTTSLGVWLKATIVNPYPQAPKFVF